MAAHITTIRDRRMPVAPVFFLAVAASLPSPSNAHVQRRAARRAACAVSASGVTRECGRCNGLLAIGLPPRPSFGYVVHQRRILDSLELRLQSGFVVHD